MNRAGATTAPTTTARWFEPRLAGYETDTAVAIANGTSPPIAAHPTASGTLSKVVTLAKTELDGWGLAVWDESRTFTCPFATRR
jgi:hypothetical protein